VQNLTINIQSIIDSVQELNPESKREILEYIEALEHENKKLKKDNNDAVKEKDLLLEHLNKTIEEFEHSHKHLKEANRLLANQNDIIDKNLQKLISAYENLEQFTYIASHDLKSPLRTISSFGQLLKSKYADRLDKTANEYLDIITSSMSQMTEVINESLIYSQIGIHKKVKIKPVQLNKVIDTVIQNLETEIQESCAQINVKPLPAIMGKKTNFVQLFQNLISNSIRYKSDKPPIINIESTAIDDKSWKISFSDNGIGIDPAYHQKIFEAFERGKVNKKKGSGLGLSISKKIVEMYKGSISVDSTVDNGATFNIFLQDLEIS